MTDAERLRNLADTLDGCEWEHPLGSAKLCRDAADELSRCHATIAEIWSLRYIPDGESLDDEQVTPETMACIRRAIEAAKAAKGAK